MGSTRRFAVSVNYIRSDAPLLSGLTPQVAIMTTCHFVSSAAAVACSGILAAGAMVAKEPKMG